MEPLVKNGWIFIIPGFAQLFNAVYVIIIVFLHRFLELLVMKGCKVLVRLDLVWQI
jgi:hypothetical protein